MSNKPKMKGLEHQNQKLQKDQGKSDDKENRLKNHKSDREPINTIICIYTNQKHSKRKKYFTKYMCVCLGRKIPWICMYVTKNTSQNIYMYV